MQELNQKATIPVQYFVANVSVSNDHFNPSTNDLTLSTNSIQTEQSRAGCDALVDEFKKRENKLHVLVNNTGVTWGGRYDDFPEEKGWDNVFNVNVKSIFYRRFIRVPLITV